jgi:hexokinase
MATPYLPKLLKQFEIPNAQLKQIARAMIGELQQGLDSDANSIKMIPSFVTQLPQGDELGTYLALDLGGTNFRVCAITLLGQGKFQLQFEKFTVPEEHKVGHGDSLFQFIAQCVESFLGQYQVNATEANPLQLGFTFSFPVQQTSINQGTIMRMSKGFECHGIVSRDAVELLQAALHARKVYVRVAALVNDTVGTLAAHAYERPNTVMGVIFGTGTNAAYAEQLPRITKLKTPYADPLMMINTEWGGFDNAQQILPYTEFDLTLDAQSTNPHQQMLEKMISGMYLGEVTRLALVSLIGQGVLNGVVPAVLSTPYAFRTESMSVIESDATPGLTLMAQELERIGIPAETNLLERQCIKAVVQQIGTRAARLSAMAVYALLEQMGGVKKPMTIAIDGSIWLKYPEFQKRLRAALDDLLTESERPLVTLETAQDGSGVGAALIAALANKQPSA